MKRSSTEELLHAELKVINIGAKIFYDSLKGQGIKVIHVDWHPPVNGDMDLVKILERLS